MKKILAAVAVAVTSFSMASAAIVNIDSQPSNNDQTLMLDAGTYEVSFIADMFEAWNAWGRVRGCDSDGENCSNGWLTNVNIESAEFGTLAVGRHGRYATSALALANAEPVLFTLTSMQQVVFRIADSYYRDNRGGVSLQVAAQSPASAAVPVPGAFMLFAGAAGFAAFRRKTA